MLSLLSFLRRRRRRNEDDVGDPATAFVLKVVKVCKEVSLILSVGISSMVMKSIVVRNMAFVVVVVVLLLLSLAIGAMDLIRAW